MSSIPGSNPVTEEPAEQAPEAENSADSGKTKPKVNWIAEIRGLALMLVDSFNADKSELATLSAVVLGSAAVLAGVLAYSGTHTHAVAPIAPYLTTDRLAQLFNLTICAGGALSVLLAGGYLREHELERGEFGDNRW